MKKPSLRRWILRIAIAGVLLLLCPIVLFLFNGLFLGYGETPTIGETQHPANKPQVKPTQVKILAWNIAKAFVHKRGVQFESEEVVRERLAGMAKLIRAEAPDLVFLSETIFECRRCPVNQVEVLAEESGLHAWAFGENYNLGLPFYRVIGGNSILSRWPLQAVANPSLTGRKPFYVGKNNRRVLWCAVKFGGKRLLLASVHNDSFDLDNNLKQTQEILAFAGDRDAVLAGDFNAHPDTASIKAIRKSGRFTIPTTDAATFPADAPQRQIDHIFAPVEWRIIEYRVIDNELSDHRPVVAVFEIEN